MVGSTAIWRIILLHTAMLSLHISVVNFNVQPSINKYQVVITLLSAKKKFTILHSARNAIGSIYPYNLSFDPSVLCPPISVYNSNTYTGQWCKNCYSSKSSRFSLQLPGLCSQYCTAFYSVYLLCSRTQKSLILHNDLQVKPEAGSGWSSC